MLKVIATAILIAVGAFVAALAYLHWAVEREGTASRYGWLFHHIVVRAIQLDRVGEIGTIARKYRNGFSYPEPDDMIEVRSKLGKLYLSGEDFDCSFDISLSSVNPKHVSPIIGTILSLRPLHYVVVFQGPPPDISPLFANPPNLDLLGPISSYSPVIEGREARPISSDLLSAFNSANHQHPDGIAWTPVECANFSYIEFTEK